MQIQNKMNEILNELKKEQYDIALEKVEEINIIIADLLLEYNNKY